MVKVEVAKNFPFPTWNLLNTFYTYFVHFCSILMSCLKHKIYRSYFRFTSNQRNLIETILLMAREYFCCNTSTSQLRFSTFFWLDFSFAVAEIRAPFSFSCDPNCLCNSTTCSFAFFKGSANFLFSPWTVARTCSFLSNLSSFPLISSFNVLEKNITKILMWKLESYYPVLPTIHTVHLRTYLLT